MQGFGLSGDTIIIDGDFVIKICETNQIRFLENIKKQKLFYNPYISAVNILDQGTIDGKNYIKMPYLKCDNCIEYISKASTRQIEILSDKIIKYFEFLIINSRLSHFDYNVWSTKIKDLEPKIKDNDLLRILLDLKNIKFSNLFYYGQSHGDFTLANLLISDNKGKLEIDAIDFLDTFIYSPINDFCKIMQDLRHLWTIHLTNNFKKIDTNRVVVFLNYLDIELTKVIGSNESLGEYYLPFQILNLLRIVPYNKDEKIFKYLKKEIISLNKELKCKQL